MIEPTTSMPLIINEQIPKEEVPLPELPLEILSNIFSFLPVNKVQELKGLSKETLTLARDRTDGPNLFKVLLQKNEKISRKEVLRMAGNPHTIHNSNSLLMAVATRDLKLIETLLDHRSMNGDHDNAALTFALENEDFDVAFLLSSNPKVTRSSLPAHTVCEFAKKGKINALEFVIRKNLIDLSFNNNFLIQFAAKGGHIDLVKLLLAENKVSPEAAENRALQMASESGNLEVFELLLNNENVKKTCDLDSIMKIATRNGHEKIVNATLKKLEIDPSSKDSTHLQQQRHNHTINAAMRIAIETSNGNVLKEFIKDGRYNPNFMVNGLGLMNALIKVEDLESIKILRNNPGLATDPHSYCVDAIKCQNFEILQYFIDEFNFVSYEILLEAANHGNCKAVEFILDHPELPNLTRAEKQVLLNGNFSYEILELLTQKYILGSDDSSTIKKLYYKYKPINGSGTWDEMNPLKFIISTATTAVPSILLAHQLSHKNEKEVPDALEFVAITAFLYASTICAFDWASRKIHNRINNHL